MTDRAADSRSSLPLAPAERVSGLRGVWGLRVLKTPFMHNVLPWLGLANLALWAAKAPLWGQDAVAYWFAGRSLLMGQPVYHTISLDTGLGYFFYAPPFAQAIAPTAVLPFVPWVVAWTALQFLVLRWLAGSRWLAGVLLLIPIVPFELQVGNVHLLLAAVLALGLTRTSAWLALLPITKLVPISLLYRPTVTPFVAGAMIGLMSFALAPSLWADWWNVISRVQPAVGQNVLPIPWAPRLAAAVVLALWARRLAEGPAGVVVTVATWLTIPTLWVNSTAILLAPLAIPASRRWLNELITPLVGGDNSAHDGTIPRPADSRPR